jgi:hypothetical protein
MPKTPIRQAHILISFSSLATRSVSTWLGQSSPIYPPSVSMVVSLRQFKTRAFFLFINFLHDSKQLDALNPIVRLWMWMCVLIFMHFMRTPTPCCLHSSYKPEKYYYCSKLNVDSSVISFQCVSNYKNAN